jgi:hypothetical protein
MRLGSLLVAIPVALTVASSAVAQGPRTDWPKSLTLVTASPGGVFYVYGEGLALILSEKLGITVNPLPTQGTVHNVKLVEAGGAQLGMTTTGVALQGWNGTGDWTGGKRFRTMRALFPMYDTPFQAVALRRSGIVSLAQLDKKRVGAGPRAGTTGVYAAAIFKALGISAELIHGSIADVAADLVAGNVDALLRVTGVPVPAIKDIEAKEPLTFLSPSPAQTEVICKALPEFSPSKIAAGAYRSLDKDYATIGMYNFAIGRSDLPDDLVYQVVKAVFENQPRLVKVHSAASETLPQNVVKNTFLPFHPGAIRYYREVGIKIPDALVPTN